MRALLVAASLAAVVSPCRRAHVASKRPPPKPVQVAVSASPPRATGPIEIPFAERRRAYVVVPHEGRRRLIAMIHGLCSPPSWACGSWKQTAMTTGFLVCPIGNAKCEGGYPTWTSTHERIDLDLEAAIAATEARFPLELDRSGAILAGFSLGGHVVPKIAARHPGRWPYLVIVEAPAPLTAAALRASGVRAVASIAGQYGTAPGAQRRTVEALAREGFPARFWLMPETGHRYSKDIERIMTEAIEFLLAH